jgi:hypothetical protein
MKKILIVLILLAAGLASPAQQKTDTVVVELANTSRVVFTIKDRADLPILRQYDFQALFTDILSRIDGTPDEVAQPDTLEEAEPFDPFQEEVVWDDDDDNDSDWYQNRESRYGRKTRHSVNFDLGVNNYLSDGKFPDDTDELYSVRPWGSWYLGINSTQRTHVGGKFYIEWGAGLSWYNFKFQKDNILMSKDENGVIFAEDDRDVNFIKSKLTASYVNASFIPMLDFGGRGKKTRFWDSYGSNFRIGIGPYAGYRIGSHSKLVYKDDGREKDKDRNNYYLNNFRYGVRLQLGIRSTDIFFNYDLNDLFSTNKPNNPKLNAFSFGLIF